MNYQLIYQKSQELLDKTHFLMQNHMIESFEHEPSDEDCEEMIHVMKILNEACGYLGDRENIEQWRNENV